MSQHGFHEIRPMFYRSWPPIDLFIETLTGNGFELKVSPTDTILVVKFKIQEAEGIPVSEQHLLYNMEELEDSRRLRDYAIENGATLKLVLSLRGGPVNTQRTHFDDGEDLDAEGFQELLDTIREEVLGNVPRGCRVSVLVYRDGDYLNLIRVVEKERGTDSSLPESWSGSSVQKLLSGNYEGTADPEGAGNESEENVLTMAKLAKLREKMEQLSLLRKPRFIPDPTYPTEEEPLPSSSNHTPQPSRSTQPSPQDRSTARPRNLLPSFSLPPIQNTELMRPVRVSQHSHTNKSFLSNPALRRSRDALNRIRRMNRTTEIQTGGLAQRDFKKQERNSSLPPLTPKSEIQSSSQVGRRISVATFPDSKPQRSVEFSSTINICRAYSERNFGSVTDGNRSAIMEERDSKMKTQQPDFPTTQNETQIPSKERVTSAIASTSACSQSRVIPDEDDRPKTSPENLSLEQKTQEICNILNKKNLQRHRHQNCSLDYNNLSLDILRRVPRTAENGFSSGDSYQLTQNVANSGIDTSMPLRSSLDNVKESCPISSPQNCTPTSRNTNSSQQRDRSKSRPPLLSEEPSELREEPSKPADLPPVLPPILPPVKKHVKRIRCGVCRKRLNITNQHICRCGKYFCSAHRYSELHDCSFDYKSEGRKILKKTNPVVTAPKLPKI